MCFTTQGEADAHIERRPELKASYWCYQGKVWHVTRKPQLSSSDDRIQYRYSKLERELHEEMANNPKTIRQRITDYMWDSYQRNKTVKFSSSMVVFAVQQEYPSAKKPNIMQEISKAKKDSTIVSLKEPVPDQRGAVYFTLARILEEETEPNVTVPKVELPAQSEKPKVIPTNPFDKVHEKLDQLATDIDSLKKIFHGGILSLDPKFAELKQIASSHVTVDGDKLADVINARLQNLKLEDSFIYRVREESYRAIEPVWDATKAINDQTVKLSQTIQERIEKLAVPTGVSNSDDYRAGIKDGIRMALEMGLKLDE